MVASEGICVGFPGEKSVRYTGLEDSSEHGEGTWTFEEIQMPYAQEGRDPPLLGLSWASPASLSLVGALWKLSTTGCWLLILV